MKTNLKSKKIKIALVHEYLVKLGGGERVLKALKDLYPQADIFTIIYDPKIAQKILKKRAKIRASFLQNFPFAVQKYPLYLWLMPKAIESLNLSKYDIIISDSHSFGKGVKFPKNAIHINYCYTPTRYLWLNPKEHLEKTVHFGPFKKIVPYYIEKLKKWDKMACKLPTAYATTCKNVQKRIKTYYNRNSEVIYAPIDANFWHKTKKKQDFFLYVSRLEPHKKPDLAVKAFNELDLPLKVVGVGSLKENLESIAKPNIEFLGEISDQKLRDLYSSAKAVVFPQDEDFGLVPIEAAACGTPTIAYKKGGSLETVIEGKTGEFFEKSTTQSLKNTIKKFKPEKFDSKYLKKHSQQFSIENFQKKFNKFVVKEFKKLKAKNSKLKTTT